MDLQPAGVHLTGAVPTELPVRHAKFLKHALDRLVALSALPWALPPCVLIAGLIKLEQIVSGDEPGSVFYRERRVSADETFDLVKFRVVTNTALAAQRRAGRTTIKDLEHDRACTTRVGRFLVRYYLDELPQLFHVLSGRMSLVGPRPVWLHDTRRRDYFAPFRIRAGLAGTFQLAKGTGDIFDLDRIYLGEYAQRGQISLVLYDLSIIWKTIQKMRQGEGL